MKKALIIIDYINDFVADGGKLTAGRPAQEIDAFIADKAAEFLAAGDYIVTANDSHTPDDPFSPESKLFPPHCVEGTTGVLLYGKTGKAVAKASDAQLLQIKKTRYSAFCSTRLDLFLRERGVKDIYLTGVCTDICVLHTAVDAYNLNYNIFVYGKGVATFNPAGHTFALEHIKNTLGGKVL